MDKKNIVNNPYQETVICIFAIGYSMIGKKILKMTLPSVQEFDMNDMFKLILIITISDMMREYLTKKKVPTCFRGCQRIALTKRERDMIW